jgi:hypothetical protein
MKKWEYLEKAVYMSKSELDNLGAEGWELVHYNPEIHHCIFKREIPEADKYYVGPGSAQAGQSWM